MFDKIKFTITDDNSTGLFCENTKDIFHSKTGALTEAEQKFINPIIFLLGSLNNINVLDICYGIGYNTKTLLNYFPNKNFTIDALEYNLDYVLISPFILDGIHNDYLRFYLFSEIENKLDVDSFEYMNILLECKRENEEFFDDSISFLSNFSNNYPYTNDESLQNNRFLHNIYYNYISKRVTEKNNCRSYSKSSINFHIGDARKTIFECEMKYDVVFLDAFSSQKDPTLWTIDFLSQVAGKMTNNAILVSYSKSTPFRSALKQLGLYVGKTFINGIDMGTVASFNSDNILNQLSDYDHQLLETRSGITYKDKFLNLSSTDILKNREIEQSNSNLLSHTQFLKNFSK